MRYRPYFTHRSDNSSQSAIAAMLPLVLMIVPPSEALIQLLRHQSFQDSLFLDVDNRAIWPQVIIIPLS
jgi:hypothetical protein